MTVSDINNQSFVIDIEAPLGSTLYSLSRATGTDVASIISINNKTSEALSLHEGLKLPLSKEKILKSSVGLNSPIPVYYKVKKGDNLYRISTRLSHTAQDLMTLNHKTSESLSWAEDLLLGWMDWPYGASVSMPLAQVEPQSQIKPQSTVSTQSLAIERKHGFTIPDIRTYISAVSDPSGPRTFDIPALSKTDISKKQEVYKEKGIAYWEKSKYQSKEMIVMHPHAKVDSKVSLYNPMLRRKVQAKVVSEMPKEAYPKDISIVISPSVASALGALDRRFQVEITYVQ